MSFKLVRKMGGGNFLSLIARRFGVLFACTAIATQGYACQTVFTYNKSPAPYRFVFGNAFGLKTGSGDQAVLQPNTHTDSSYQGFSWGSTQRFIEVFALNAPPPLEAGNGLASASISDLDSGTIECDINPNPVSDPNRPITLTCYMIDRNNCN